MAPNARVLHTIFGPYRTAQAVQRAELADFIPVPISNTNINAVHPIPIHWLRDELLPQELEQLREHVVSLLDQSHGQSTDFIAAVNETLNNLETMWNGHSNRPRSTTAQASSVGPRSVRFADMDDISRDVEEMNLGGTRSMQASSQPRSILRTPARPALSRSTTVPASSVRQPSPNRDAMLAIEVHLNEVESRINRRFEGGLTADVLRQCRESIAHARAHISRARTFTQLTSDDLELARAMVESVCSIEEARPAHRRHLPARTAPVDAWDRPSRQARREWQQDELRERAHRQRRIPLFRSDPVRPQVGDGLLLPDHEVLILAPNGRWLRYHSSYVRGGGVYLLEDD